MDIQENCGPPFLYDRMKQKNLQLFYQAFLYHNNIQKIIYASTIFFLPFLSTVFN